MLFHATICLSFVQGSRGRPAAIPSVSATSGPPAGPASRLDLTDLEPTVQHFFEAGLAPSTQKTYKAAMKRFHSFCITYNVTEPFPLSEQLLYSYASYLADQGLAPQTGKSYLSAPRSMQISLGLPDPREQSSLPVLKRVQAGISCSKIRKQGLGSPSQLISWTEWESLCQHPPTQRKL